MQIAVYGKKRTHMAEITHKMIDRIDNRLTFVDATECLTWTGAKTPDGYGVIKAPGRIVLYVHRVIYTVHTAPIPEGWVVDHTCRNRACANPEHLEAVIWAENSRRVFARRKAGIPW